MSPSRPSRIRDYEVKEEIGSGSMGVVYRAESKAGEEVAIKVFRPDDSLSNKQRLELQERFAREANLLKEIDHPNVVVVSDSGRAEGQDFIVMEFLDGFNLKELKEMGRDFSPREAVDIAGQVLNGLEAIHAHGVVHRDIKPSNVILRDDSTAVITDFGIARELTEETLAQSDNLLGTPAYMAPEQITGEQVGKAADIYSTGVLLYELLTGERAFPGDLTEAIYRVVNENPASPEVYRPELSPELVGVVERALRKDPADRFESVDEFRRALDELTELETELQSSDDSAVLQTGSFPATAAPDGAAGRTAHGDASGSGQNTQSGGSGSGGSGGGQSNLSHLLKTGALPGSSNQLQTGSGDLVYCVECGMPNQPAADNCKRCKAPLLKRDHQSDSSGFNRPSDYQVQPSELLGCINLIVMAVLLAAVLALLFL